MHYINKLLIVRLISYTTGRESRIMCDSGQKLKHFHEKKKTIASNSIVVCYPFWHMWNTITQCMFYSA